MQSRMASKALVFPKTISNIKRSFSEVQGGRGMSLTLLLSVTQRFCATDPKDKVLALIGLANNPHPSIVPDYFKSIKDVYTEVTGYSMIHEQSLSLLTIVEGKSCREILDLPSWVPDYSVWQNVVMFGFPVSRIKYRAAGTSAVSLRWKSESSGLLAADGIQQDQVDTVSSTSFDVLWLLHTEDIVKWLRVVEPLLRRGSTTLKAFWRTLLGDYDRDTWPAPDHCGDHFVSYLSHIGEQKTLEQWSRRGSGEPEEGSASLFQASLEFVAWQRKFLITRKGYIGLGPQSVQLGDSVCILSRGHVAFLLRKDGGHHTFVAESYVHGLMNGEAVQGNVQMKEFFFPWTT